MLFAPDPGGPQGPPGADKVVHLALFALLAGTALWRFGRDPRLLAAVLAYAALSEVVQGVALARRSGDLLDLLADSLGALLGWVVAGRLLARRTTGAAGG